MATIKTIIIKFPYLNLPSSPSSPSSSRRLIERNYSVRQKAKWKVIKQTVKEAEKPAKQKVPN